MSSSEMMYSCGPTNTDEHGLGDLLGPIYNCSVPIQHVECKTFREQWTIGTRGGRGLAKSLQAALHDDDIYMNKI